MSARRRARATTDATPADVAALAAEVERQGAVIVELVGDRERQAEVNARLAQRVVEIGTDVAELHAVRRRKVAAPPDLTALKTAVAMTPLSYETCRRWCVQCGKEIGAARVGCHWFVAVPELLAKIKRMSGR